MQRIIKKMLDMNAITTVPDKIFEAKWGNPLKMDRKEKFGICFCVFFNYQWRSISFSKETRHLAMCSPKFDIFLIFPN